MSWKFATGLSIFWLLMAIWAWVTGTSIGFIIGAPIAAVAFGVLAIVMYRKHAGKTRTPHAPRIVKSRG